jgi:hypothetical protein
MSEPVDAHVTNVVAFICGRIAVIKLRCGSARAKLFSASLSRHADSVQNVLDRSWASREYPTRPSAAASWRLMRAVARMNDGMCV